METPELINISPQQAKAAVGAFNGRVAEWDVIPKLVLRFDERDNDNGTM